MPKLETQNGHGVNLIIISCTKEMIIILIIITPIFKCHFSREQIALSLNKRM